MLLLALSLQGMERFIAIVIILTLRFTEEGIITLVAFIFQSHSPGMPPSAATSGTGYRHQ